MPVFKQAVEILDQLPPLLQSIADGQRDFVPSPDDTKEVCRRMYRARRTLLVQFETDTLDESPSIEKVLKEANTIMRMKRPMVEMDVERRVLRGTHITPLTQNIILDPQDVTPDGPLRTFTAEIPIPDPLEGLRADIRANFLQTVDDVRAQIVDWLNSSV